MKETAKERLNRKRAEFRYAVYRTACSLGGFIFQVLGFTLSLYIAWRITHG